MFRESDPKSTRHRGLQIGGSVGVGDRSGMAGTLAQPSSLKPEQACTSKSFKGPSTTVSSKPSPKLKSFRTQAKAVCNRLCSGWNHLGFQPLPHLDHKHFAIPCNGSTTKDTRFCTTSNSFHTLYRSDLYAPPGCRETVQGRSKLGSNQG